MDQSHQNQFLNQSLLFNDVRRRKRSRDELDTPSDQVRQRRRLNRLYDPEVQRNPLWNVLFSIACRQRWPRSTLFTATYLFDSYVVDRDLPLAELNLCGLASLFLAAKLETDNPEIGVGEIMGYLELPDNSRSRVYQMERRLCEFFGFNLWINHPYRLWDRLRDSLGIRDIIVRDFVRFLIDVCAMDDRFIDESPSCIVAASLFLTLNILNMKWTRSMSRLTGFLPDELHAPVDTLIDSLLGLDTQSSLYGEWSRYRTAESVDGVLAMELEIGDRRRRRRYGPDNYLHPSEYIIQWTHHHYHL